MMLWQLGIFLSCWFLNALILIQYLLFKTFLHYEYMQGKLQLSACPKIVVFFLASSIVKVLWHNTETQIAAEACAISINGKW